MHPETDDGDALRLIKLRLPAALVRQMDERIVASRGTYLDRNEFVREAIWDRLNEDADLRDDARPTPVDNPPARVAAPTVMVDKPGEAVAAAVPLPLRAAVDARGNVPTLPRQPSTGTIFGLHNRDLPTVWTLTHLALMAAADGGPVAWNSFVARIRPEAQRAGELLRALDKRSHAAVKAAVGFPRPGDKGKSSEDRLINTAVGAPTRSGFTGPAVLLGLVAPAEQDQPRPAVAPTREALDLLAAFADAGYGVTLPPPEAAARCWLSYVAGTAPEEYAAWLSVLRAVGDKPTRTELVACFPEWPGSTADTNTTGYVSRGREWGLIEPEMSEGRYRLTPLGEHVAAEGNTQ